MIGQPKSAHRWLWALALVGMFAARRAEAQTPLPRAGWVATASTANGGEGAAKAIDGSASTRFSTGAAQTAGQWFSLDMLTPQTFSQLTIDPAGSAGDFSRGYQVFVSNDAITWGTPVASGTGAAGVLTIIFPTQIARFVGIVQTSAASSWWSIAEINVYGPGATPTVALPPTGWVASASSTRGADKSSRVFDGNLGTRWTTGLPQANGQWFQVDMLQSQTVAKVTLNAGGNANDYPRGYQIFVSSSAGDLGNPVASGAGTTSIVTATFTPVTGRYLRIVQTGSASSWWSIAELTIFGVGNPAPVAMALPRTGWTATASSTCQPDVPVNAFDDNASTRWSNGLVQAPGQFFQIDMQIPRDFTKITLDAGGSNGDYPRAFSLYISNNPANFGAPIATGPGTGQVVTISFASRNARYIRIVQTGSSATNWWSIHELNVYGLAPAILIREGWVASASVNTSNARHDLDGNLGTRWSAGGPQSGGQYVQVDMRAPQDFNQITLDAGYPSSEFPRGYEVFVGNDPATFGRAVATGVGSAGLVSISFPTMNARFIRVVQTGSSSSPWSIAELVVYGSTVPVGGPPPVAFRPPRKLPQPPRQQGCYVGTANGWAPVTCTAATALDSVFGKPDVNTVVQSSPFLRADGTSSAIPFEFGQVEGTFVAFGGETDSRAGDNSLSLQANTNFFVGSNAHMDWMQFVIQTRDSAGGMPFNKSQVCIWYIDVDRARDSLGFAGYDNLCVGGNMPNGYHLAKRSGPYQALDFATIAGSTYTDNTNQAVIGMVAQLSWFDPVNDPNLDRGLYAVVGPDTFGLAGRWTEVGGTIVGLSNSSTANFTDSSVLTRTLAGSCANAPVTALDIPWPGLCPTQPVLLPHSIITSDPTTGESSNLIDVGSPMSLVAFSPDLVATQFLSSTSGTCVAGASRAFLRDSPGDTGVVPSNVGGLPFWESPDLILVPHNAQNIDVNTAAGDTLLTPGEDYDLYVRINNDFGCSPITGVKSLAYLADPAALSTAWQTITNGDFVGDAAHPEGVTVPAGGRVLLGPLTFTAPASNFGDGHKCLLASIQADGQPAPANLIDAPASIQVAQRNVQLAGCAFPLTNATPAIGNLTVTLSVPTGAVPSTTGINAIDVTFEDPAQVFFNAWLPGAGPAYSVVQSGGLTKVRLGQMSVTLAAVPLGPGLTVIARGNLAIGAGEPTTTLTLAATLTDQAGAVLVSNGGSCVGDPPPIIN